MLIESKHFGKLEIEEKEIITFPEGILGFQEINGYVLLEEKDSPFFWLQAVDVPEVCFIIVDPRIFYPDYNPNVAEDILASLEIKDKTELAYYTIVVIPDDVKKMRTNLQAPLVVNLQKRVAKQIVLNQPEYPLRYFILQELERGGKNAGIDQKTK